MQKLTPQQLEKVDGMRELIKTMILNAVNRGFNDIEIQKQKDEEIIIRIVKSKIEPLEDKPKVKIVEEVEPEKLPN